MNLIRWAGGRCSIRVMCHKGHVCVKVGGGTVHYPVIQKHLAAAVVTHFFSTRPVKQMDFEGLENLSTPQGMSRYRSPESDSDCCGGRDHTHRFPIRKLGPVFGRKELRAKALYIHKGVEYEYEFSIEDGCILLKAEEWKSEMSMPVGDWTPFYENVCPELNIEGWREDLYVPVNHVVQWSGGSGTTFYRMT